MPVLSPGFDLGFFALFVDGRGQGLPGMADQRMPAGAQIVSGRGLGRRAGRIEQGHSWFNWNLSVGGFAPQPAIMENHLAFVNVVPKPIAAQRKPPLAFTSRNSDKLLDVMSPASVVWIGFEDLQGAVQESAEVGVASKQIPNEPLKP